MSIETILDETRNGFDADYRAWGKEAYEKAERQEPELNRQLAFNAWSAITRKRLGREAARTRDGLLRYVADRETGQMTAWLLWTDPETLRREGRRLMAEGASKAASGQKMLQAADCVDVHPGMCARDAWVAEGLDPTDLDAATAADEAA